jgi:hypothetical protein
VMKIGSPRNDGDTSYPSVKQGSSSAARSGRGPFFAKAARTPIDPRKAENYAYDYSYEVAHVQEKERDSRRNDK